MPALTVIACHECDLLQRETILPPGGTACCRRCGAVLYRNKPDGLDRTLAFTLGAAVLFVLANLNPVVGLDAQGTLVSTTLFGTVRTLHEQDMTSVALLVFVTTLLMPALEIGAMLYLLLPLKLGWVPKNVPVMFRLIHTVRPWGMVEVFMLGTLVSLAKLSHIAAVLPGIALWSFGALMFLLAAAAASFEPRDFWAQVDSAGRRRQRVGVVTTLTEASR
jgi:paraquat-inducible protein A